MAYTKERKNGRFTAMYWDNGKEKSAGTYATKAEAQAMAEKQEAFVAGQNRGLSPAEKATMTLDEYFPLWLRNHPVELSTKKSYRSVYRAYIRGPLGKRTVSACPRQEIRSLLADMRERKLAVSTQHSAQTLLSGMFRVAVEDGYRPDKDNPAEKLRVQKKARGTAEVTVLTVEQFDTVMRKLPTLGARVLAQVIIATGCRPSEAFVLLVSDIDFEARTVRFNKALKDVDGEDLDEDATEEIGGTKVNDVRVLKVNPGVLRSLQRWIEQQQMSEGDMLFPRDLVLPRQRARSVHIDLTPELLATLGTKVAPNGREYRHGTYNCYVTAKCRDCDYCRQAFADYRYDLERRKGRVGHARRATSGRRGVPVSPYITPRMWRDRFQDACTDAELPFMPTAYQLRHTHASWLIAKGEDPKTVMKRMGHTSLATTNIYVHAVDSGESAADIMDDLDLDWDVA